MEEEEEGVREYRVKQLFIFMSRLQNPDQTAAYLQQYHHQQQGATSVACATDQSTGVAKRRLEMIERLPPSSPRSHHRG